MVYHQIFYLSITNRNNFFIIKLNCSSPNSINFHQISKYLNHQIYWSVTKNNYFRQRQSLVNNTYFYEHFVTKAKNLFQVSSIIINFLFLKVKSQYNHYQNYWWFSKWLWWLENEKNFGDFIKKNLVKTHWIWWYYN